MSKLNNTAQIKMLRSDSERKIGEVFLELSNKEKSDENFRLAEEHLKKSLQAMMELKDKSELGKIDEHKIKLVEKKLNSIKTQQL